MLRTSDYDYNLPKELIAQIPAQIRDESRLLVYKRQTKEIEHRNFYDILDYLKEGDALVLNETRVLPARLLGKRADTGGRMEMLLLSRKKGNKWEVLCGPAKRAAVGREFIFGDNLLVATVLKLGEEGIRIVEFKFNGIFEEVLDKVGVMPLPPYIHARLEDRERYQTVYSRVDGSAAAPTAGLHFTDELMEKIKSKGVTIHKLLLHVGLGTFRPVKADDLSDHNMHSEYYEVNNKTANALNNVRKNGGRIICVGTTSARTLETVTDDKGMIRASSGWTDIFIYPGYKFKAVDCLITNFHLPKSTLLMMISALAGRENILTVYEAAVKERYRFFSFGDAMFII